MLRIGQRIGTAMGTVVLASAYRLTLRHAHGDGSVAVGVAVVELRAGRWTRPPGRSPDAVPSEVRQ